MYLSALKLHRCSFLHLLEGVAVSVLISNQHFFFKKMRCATAWFVSLCLYLLTVYFKGHFDAPGHQKWINTSVGILDFCNQRGWKRSRVRSVRHRGRGAFTPSCPPASQAGTKSTWSLMETTCAGRMWGIPAALTISHGGQDSRERPGLGGSALGLVLMIKWSIYAISAGIFMSFSPPLVLIRHWRSCLRTQNAELIKQQLSWGVLSSFNRPKDFFKFLNSSRRRFLAEGNKECLRKCGLK